MQKYQALKGDEVIEQLTFSATTTTGTQTFAAATINGQPKRLVVSNSGTVAVHVKQGNSTVTAATTDKVVLAGQSRAFLFSAGDSVAIRTASGTATVYAEACN
jgi:hypothetical protein